MANKKITQLTAYSSGSAVSTDVLPIVDIANSETKKMTIADLGIKILEEKLTSTAVYIGDSMTDGSFRLFLTGGNLAIQKRIAGVWTDKDVIG